MIHVKKLSARRSDVNMMKHCVLDIDTRCGVCKSICNITSMSDLDVTVNSRGNSVDLYYMCPVCGARQFLGFRNIATVRKHMKAINLTDSDLSTFHALCKRAKEDRDNLFDAIYFACKKRLDVPRELYDIDGAYTKEIKFILSLISANLVTSKYEYEKYRSSFSFVMAMAVPSVIPGIEKGLPMKMTHKETEDGITYTISNEFETMSFNTDQNNNVKTWVGKFDGDVRIWGSLGVDNDDNDKEA